MDEALYACRFVQFTAAMLIFGTAAFRDYALADSDTAEHRVFSQGSTRGSGMWRSRPRWSP